MTQAQKTAEEKPPQKNEVVEPQQETPQKKFGSEEPLPRSSYIGCGGYKGV